MGAEPRLVWPDARCRITPYLQRSLARSVEDSTFFLEAAPEAIPFEFEVVARLHIEPEVLGGAEIAAKRRAVSALTARVITYPGCV